MNKKILIILIIALLSNIAHATPTVPVFVDSGRLISSYAFEDGSAVLVIVHHSNGSDTGIFVMYVRNGERDCLRMFSLPYDVEISKMLTEVCGGRLHLSYQANEHVWHATVDLPEAELLYLPVVCGNGQ